VKRIFKSLGPVGWLILFAMGIPLAGAAFAEPVSDRAVAEQILASLASPSDPSMQTVLKTPIDEAKHALERAAGARRSGDAHHAEILEGLGREWAETARDLARAVSVEADAGALETAAAEAGVGSERARALLEEAIARRGRAEAELEKLSADAGLFPTRPTSSASVGAKPSKTPKPAASAASAAKGAK
jgi:hypothetical protein